MKLRAKSRNGRKNVKMEKVNKEIASRNNKAEYPFSPLVLKCSIF